MSDSHIPRSFIRWVAWLLNFGRFVFPGVGLGLGCRLINVTSPLSKCATGIVPSASIHSCFFPRVLVAALSCSNTSSGSKPSKFRQQIRACSDMSMFKRFSGLHVVPQAL